MGTCYSASAGHYTGPFSKHTPRTLTSGNTKGNGARSQGPMAREPVTQIGQGDDAKYRRGRSDEELEKLKARASWDARNRPRDRLDAVATGAIAGSGF